MNLKRLSKIQDAKAKKSKLDAEIDAWYDDLYKWLDEPIPFFEPKEKSKYGLDIEHDLDEADLIDAFNIHLYKLDPKVTEELFNDLDAKYGIPEDVDKGWFGFDNFDSLIFKQQLEVPQILEVARKHLDDETLSKVIRMAQDKRYNHR